MLNHENIKSYEYINRPHTVRQMMVEIESLEKLIKKGEVEGRSKVIFEYHEYIFLLIISNRMKSINFSWNLLTKRMNIRN